MTESAAQSGSDALLETIDRASRSSYKVLIRWLADTELSLLAACVIATLHPEDAPMSVAEVAEALGISNDESAHALHELRSAGYAREDDRRYSPTDKSLRLHESLDNARRESIRTFLSNLSDDARRELADAASQEIRR